jgi:hypothetical protein
VRQPPRHGQGRQPGQQQTRVGRLRRRLHLIRGFDSPLRHRLTLASCRHSGHAIWWSMDAATAGEAVALLPYYVGERASVTRVEEIEIP